MSGDGRKTIGNVKRQVSRGVRRYQEVSGVSGDVRCQDASGGIRRRQELSRRVRSVRKCQEVSGCVRRRQDASGGDRRYQKASGVIKKCPECPEMSVGIRMRQEAAGCVKRRQEVSEGSGVSGVSGDVRRYQCVQNKSNECVRDAIKPTE